MRAAPPTDWLWPGPHFFSHLRLCLILSGALCRYGQTSPCLSSSSCFPHKQPWPLFECKWIWDYLSRNSGFQIPSMQLWKDRGWMFLEVGISWPCTLLILWEGYDRKTDTGEFSKSGVQGKCLSGPGLRALVLSYNKIECMPSENVAAAEKVHVLPWQFQLSHLPERIATGAMHLLNYISNTTKARVTVIYWHFLLSPSSTQEIISASCLEVCPNFKEHPDSKSPGNTEGSFHLLITLRETAQTHGPETQRRKDREQTRRLLWAVRCHYLSVRFWAL